MKHVTFVNDLDGSAEQYRKYENYSDAKNITVPSSAEVPRYENMSQPRYMSSEPEREPPSHAVISCIDAANHVSSCPVCSKLYTCDKTIYLVIIAILTILVILLAKKLFNL